VTIRRTADSRQHDFGFVANGSFFKFLEVLVQYLAGTALLSFRLSSFSWDARRIISIVINQFVYPKSSSYVTKLNLSITDCSLIPFDAGFITYKQLNSRQICHLQTSHIGLRVQRSFKLNSNINHCCCEVKSWLRIADSSWKMDMGQPVSPLNRGT
jgi:hypothetical protein